MADNTNLLLEDMKHGRFVARWRSIWQMRLMKPSDLAKFSKDRGLPFWEKDILLLWKSGLLRADMVVSSVRIRRTGFVEIGKGDEGWIYSDERPIPIRKHGWANMAVGKSAIPEKATPLFHPFRYFVLYHLNRVLEVHISRMQMLIGVERFPELVNIVTSEIQRWSSTPQAARRLNYWSDIASLAVACEPFTYEPIMRSWRHNIQDDPDVLRSLANELRTVVEEWFRKIGLDRLEEVRQDLCLATQMLDDNRNVHTLLVLTDSHNRLKITGRLGGAIHLRTMAEMIRRVSEAVWSVKLPEEDELGFGWMPPNLKERLYGQARLLDGDRSGQLEFLRRFHLDRGLRVRWYVEGETEAGALQAVVGTPGEYGIEVINLAGKVAQKGHVAFRDNLRADISMGVFSFVSLDADRVDNRRALDRAVRDNEFFGVFLIADPDFEFANFGREELADLLWDVAAANGACSEERSILDAALATANNGKALMAASTRALPILARVGKGEDWGRRLGRYAMDHPHKADGQIRPFVEQVRLAFQARRVSYYLSRRDLKVDPNSGQLVSQD